MPIFRNIFNKLFNKRIEKNVVKEYNEYFFTMTGIWIFLKKKELIIHICMNVGKFL